MFNLFFNKRNNDEYISCHWLEHGINFDYSSAKICCMCFHEAQGQLPEIDYCDRKFNYNKFFTQKEKIRKLHRKGIIYDKCKGCINLVKKKWDKNNYINHINFDNQSACNASCIYCYTSEDKDYYNSQIAYKIIPTVKTLLNKKLLRPGGEVMFGGGEPTINDEFEELVNLLLDNGFEYIKVHTSGIKYNKAIERCLNEDKGDIIISPDSGTRELYKKIKQVDSFENVWANLKKYSSAQNKNKIQVKAKYIIIPNVNDSNKDIDDFFNKVIESSINSVRMDIEMNWYNENRSNDEKLTHMFELLKYSEEKSRELSIKQFFFQAQAQTAINEHKDLFNRICSTSC